jgi:predicted RNase H-like HicB family nuclease
MGELFLKVEIEPLEEGGFLATSDELPGLVAQGRTVAETMEIAQDVARKLIESYVDHNDPLPPKIAQALKRRARKESVKLPIALPAVLCPA